MPQETKDKLSSSLLGKKHNEGTKVIISLALVGRPVSKETRNKISSSQSGEKGKHAKLNWKQVIEIRDLRKKGHTYLYISKLYGVNKGTIGDIIRGKSWKTTDPT